MAQVDAFGRLLLTVAVLSGPGIRAQSPKVGKPAPEFALPTINGDSVRLSQFRGRPVVLTFWATWCPSCRTEMPNLDTARVTHASAGLQVLTINGEQTAEQVRRYLRDLPAGFDLSLVFLLDRKHRVSDHYFTPGLPSTFFVDSGGILRAIHYGPLEAAELARSLRTILPTPSQEE